MAEIETIWRRIQSLEGEQFYQIRGKSFAYEIKGDYLHPTTTNQGIPKKHFAEALEDCPLADTVPVQHLRGPSYIYAVLMDKRIRQGES